jgi:hypothetical protein
MIHVIPVMYFMIMPGLNLDSPRLLSFTSWNDTREWHTWMTHESPRSLYTSHSCHLLHDNESRSSWSFTPSRITRVNDTWVSTKSLYTSNLSLIYFMIMNLDPLETLLREWHTRFNDSPRRLLKLYLVHDTSHCCRLFHNHESRLHEVLYTSNLSFTSWS